VIAECNCRVQAVSADSCSECSRNKQSEMKTAGNRLRVDCCEQRLLLYVRNSDSAMEITVIKTCCNVSC
jgi:hypothetical protein